MSKPDPITPAQRSALGKLAPVISDDFYLAGGVGVAARLSHRPSRDLDLFSASDPTRRLSELEHLAGVVVTGRAEGTVHLLVDGVPVSLLQYGYPMLAPPEHAAGLPIRVASTDDLACMKLSAIAGRGLARDFWDLHELMAASGRSLAEYLAAFRTKYVAQDVGHVIRSLAYFGDAESQPLPIGMADPLWKRIRQDFEAWVGALIRSTGGS